MTSGGVVAAGHPETAEAGARALREGGNAVDAAVAAVGASLVTESPLTGLGAGGHMLVHRPGEEAVLLDFFVAAPGLGSVERSAELVPVEIDFGDATQVFNIGVASCGVPGVPSGLAEAAGRFGSMPLAVLLERGAELARDGVVLNREQAYLLALLAPIVTIEPAGEAIYSPGGRMLDEGETLSFPELADSIELLGERGATPFYDGEIAAAMSDRVLEGGGLLTREDLAAYETIARKPVRASFRGREFLSNPPPSSGGVLIALALELLGRRETVDVATTVEVMEAVQEARSPEFIEGLHEEGFERRFLADRLGSTTHITAVDAAGGCASVTCSNGSGSGVFVDGTGIHVNNMLGEQDLNPFGFHAIDPARRLPSMMSPSIVLRDGELELGLGSGGSNRIRSAITQVILRMLADGLDVAEAVAAPRVHFEAGVVHAEPGVDEAALERLAAAGHEIVRWREPNLYFGGVHAVAVEPDRSAVGAGDPRRGGAVAVG